MKNIFNKWALFFTLFIFIYAYFYLCNCNFAHLTILQPCEATGCQLGVCNPVTGFLFYIPYLVFSFVVYVLGSPLIGYVEPILLDLLFALISAAIFYGFGLGVYKVLKMLKDRPVKKKKAKK